MKRIERVIPELLEAHQKGDSEEVEGILKSLKMPSSKEWRKGIERLLFTATESGILRAHLELLRLRELYEFQDSWLVDVIPEGYDYDVVLPEEAREFIRKNAYEIGVITEETVINRIRKTLEQCLEEGLPPKEMTQRVKETVGTWISDFHAQTIARTESGKYYNAGRLARWLDPEQNGFVEALQYDAILDRRTTEICRHLDGRIISIEDSATIAEMTPPNHFQCRSTWLPVTKYEEWEDNFDRSVKPEKGFQFQSPLPKLLQGKKEPLVQPKPKFDPRKVTDPDIIRSLPDEDFKVAIGNVKDISLKLSMVKERAEQILVRENGLNELKLNPDFMWLGFFSDKNEGAIALYGKVHSFFMTPAIKPTVEELMSELKKVKNDADKMDSVLSQYEKKYTGSVAHMDLVRAIRGIRRRLGKATMNWKGLVTVKRSEEAKKLFTIKEPPRSANYKRATGLQQALKDAQSWIDKYLDDKLAPQSGIKMRFKYDITRAYAIGMTGEIFFGMYSGRASTVIHEVGHVLHWNNEAVSELIEEFFMQRTEHLQAKWGEYNGETVIPDDFFNQYVGRIYGWEKQTRSLLEKQGSNLKVYGQEVLSMGLQAMYEDPVTFYEEDKEHFLLIYAIMRGLF